MTIAVGMEQIAVSRDASETLVCYGLGSCICVAMHDPIRRIGGMAHVVLPAPFLPGSEGSPGKYATTAIPALLGAMEAEGASRQRIVCCIAGGASVLKIGVFAPGQDIGSRNAQAVREALQRAGLAIAQEEVGGSHGRTAYLHVGTGAFVVTSVRRDASSGTAGGTARQTGSERR